MISLDEALERILVFAEPLGTERLNLMAAAGSTLAKPVRAQMSQPPFDASAMDGYAMQAADAHAGSSLEIIGTSQAGAGYTGRVAPGQCVRIFTGAPMPSGADTVVMQEKTAPRGTNVILVESTDPQANVRRMGQDFKQNDTLLKTGEYLTPGAIALAAAANNAELHVYRKPRIALLATGDELVTPGKPINSDQIVASNSFALSALFSPYASVIGDLGIAPDDETLLRRKIDQALNSDADVIVTTGGASVGDHDLVQPMLREAGVEIGFWKIAMRPGKPLMFGKKGNKLVFGLPGNPVSALVTATVVVLPALRALNGIKASTGGRLRLPLSTALPANGPRRHFIRAQISAKADGISSVRPVGENDSAHLSSFHKANALIIHPEDAPAKPVGQIVDVIPLRTH